MNRSVRILTNIMARQSKLEFTRSSTIKKPAIKSKTKLEQKSKLTNSAKEITRKSVVAVTSNIQGDSSTNRNGFLPFRWCSTYPGSLVSLSDPKLTSGTYDIKIASWNINGIRAWIKKGCLQYILNESPDIIGVQEIKCAKKDIPITSEIDGYKAHWYPAQKSGYSGTGIYSKISPIKVTFGIGESKHDNEGRLITAEFDKFFLINTYVPNSGQGLVRLGYRTKEWNDALCTHIKKLDKEKPVILTGDLNVSHQEIDLANPAGNHRTAGFTDEERKGFAEMLTECDMVDTYRQFYPDREKAYTYWSARHNSRSNNAGWRLDYFVVSRRLFPHVIDQEIRCGVLGSDHCPLVLYLKF